MHELRLVGVHEDGEQLILTGPGGEKFRLPIDEALRVASARGKNSLHRSQTETKLSPRDIQIRIRAGETAEQVAAAANLPLEHVRKYEGPVLAEREHTALLAQSIPVSEAMPHHDGYRSAFGDNPATLGQMVTHRLIALGIDGQTLSWDAWRRPDGQWNITANFDASKVTTISEDPPAQWVFQPSTRYLHASNAWARTLSHIETHGANASRLRPVHDRPFDLEADQTPASTPRLATPPGPPTPSAGPALLDLLQSRRGQRLGENIEADEELATLLTRTHSENAENPASDLDIAPTAFTYPEPPHSSRTALPHSAEENQKPFHPDEALAQTRFARSLAPQQQQQTGESATTEEPPADDPAVTTQLSLQEPQPAAEADLRLLAPTPPPNPPTGTKKTPTPQQPSTQEGGTPEAAPQPSPTPTALNRPRERPREKGKTPAQHETEALTHTKTAESNQKDETGSSKTKRRALPSWDDIIFGSKK